MAMRCRTDILAPINTIKGFSMGRACTAQHHHDEHQQRYVHWTASPRATERTYLFGKTTAPLKGSSSKIIPSYESHGHDPCPDGPLYARMGRLPRHDSYPAPESGHALIPALAGLLHPRNERPAKDHTEMDSGAFPGKPSPLQTEVHHRDVDAESASCGAALSCSCSPVLAGRHPAPVESCEHHPSDGGSRHRLACLPELGCSPSPPPPPSARSPDAAQWIGKPWCPPHQRPRRQDRLGKSGYTPSR